MGRMAKELDHLLLHLRAAGDAGLPAANDVLAQELTEPQLQVSPKHAAVVKEFAMRCCYASQKGDRLRITHIGMSRLERLYAEQVAH
jgi:hypothetical protein